MAEPLPKPIIWMGDSQEVLRDFPALVQDEVGFALYRTQGGSAHTSVKPLKGFGSGVLEVISDHRGDTFRAVYTVHFAETVYVLHAFQKKSTKGIVTLARELDLVKARLKQAEALHRPGEPMMATKKAYVISSGNVFADLGLPHPEERLAKAELAHKIITAIERRGLTQASAAKLLEVDQPKISALKRGRLAGFSLDRLVRFLVLLGNDVEIVVKAHRRSARSARLMIA
jgi:phage-related protein/predicted XRE-type DNA-binding protein